MSQTAFDYLISEIYSIPTTNESYIDKIVEKAKKIKNSEQDEIKFINNTGWLTTYREEQLIKAIELARETKEVEGFRFPIPKYTEQEIIDIINS